MKTKHIINFNEHSNKLVDYGKYGISILPNVLAVQVDNTLQPQLTEGSRYILTNINSLHSSFGTINKFFAGYDEEGEKILSNYTLKNNDVVEYVDGQFVVVYAVDNNSRLIINNSTDEVLLWDGSTWKKFIEVDVNEGKKQYSPTTKIAKNTEVTITLDHNTRTDYQVKVSVEGDTLKETDTSVSGAYGYSHTKGTNIVKIRVPYSIDTDETVVIYYMY